MQEQANYRPACSCNLPFFFARYTGTALNDSPRTAGGRGGAASPHRERRPCPGRAGPWVRNSPPGNPLTPGSPAPSTQAPAGGCRGGRPLPGRSGGRCGTVESAGHWAARPGCGPGAERGPGKGPGSRGEGGARERPAERRI